jgi:hypothetical protein
MLYILSSLCYLYLVLALMLALKAGMTMLDFRTINISLVFAIHADDLLTRWFRIVQAAVIVCFAFAFLVRVIGGDINAL